MKKYYISVQFLNGVVHHGFQFHDLTHVSQFVHSLYLMDNYQSYDIKTEVNGKIVEKRSKQSV